MSEEPRLTSILPEIFKELRGQTKTLNIVRASVDIQSASLTTINKTLAQILAQVIAIGDTQTKEFLALNTLPPIDTKLQAITLALKQIHDFLVFTPGSVVRFRIDAQFDNQFKLEDAMAFQLQDTQKVTLALVPLDADNNPTTLPAGVVPAWSSSDTTKATATVAPDGLSAVVFGQSMLGDVQINVSVAMPTGTTLTGQLIITIVAGPAATLQVNPGTPTAQ